MSITRSERRFLMKTKTFKDKLLAVFLAVAVAVTMIPGGFMMATQNADAATTITLTGKKFEYKDAYGDWHTTTKFTGSGYTGLCAAAHRHSITGSHSYTMATPNATMIKLAYYYGYTKGWTSGVNGAKLSRAFNYVSTDTKTKDRGKAFNFKESTLKDMVNTIILTLHCFCNISVYYTHVTIDRSVYSVYGVSIGRTGI